MYNLCIIIYMSYSYAFYSYSYSLFVRGSLNIVSCGNKMCWQHLTTSLMVSGNHTHGDSLVQSLQWTSHALQALDQERKRERERRERRERIKSFTAYICTCVQYKFLLSLYLNFILQCKLKLTPVKIITCITISIIIVIQQLLIFKYQVKLPAVS